MPGDCERDYVKADDKLVMEALWLLVPIVSAYVNIIQDNMRAHKAEVSSRARGNRFSSIYWSWSCLSAINPAATPDEASAVFLPAIFSAAAASTLPSAPYVPLSKVTRTSVAGVAGTVAGQGRSSFPQPTPAFT